MNNLYPFFIFVLLIAVLFFISKASIQVLFEVLRRFFSSQRIVFSIISFIFFPGTILHELSHALVAMVLLLKVREIHIFPEWEDDHIKLGKVLYEKKDFFRGILVGIAPIIVGLIFFLILSLWNIQFKDNILFNIGFFYIIFVVSTTMFSSRQDMKDLVYILPLVIILIGIIYVFDISLSWIWENQFVSTNGADIINRINYYLFLSILIHFGLMGILKILSFKK